MYFIQHVLLDKTIALQSLNHLPNSAAAIFGVTSVIISQNVTNLNAVDCVSGHVSRCLEFKFKDNGLK